MGTNRTEIKLGTGNLTYFVLGEGRPLLYLHSAGGAIISPFLEWLSASHRIYTPIAPGFDGTPFHKDVRGIRGLAALYAEFINAVIKAPCDVMGHSFGGWTALWLAAEHPNLVDQIVLEAPAGLRFGQQAGPPPDPAEVRRRVYAYPEKAKGLIKPPETTASNVQAFARYSQEIMVDEELLTRLPSTRARTLIVLASKDELVPAKAGQVLKERLPASHLTYVYDAAHAIEVDQPERMLRLVKAFLERGEAYIVNFGGAAA
jgi:pimeloyl-ACP methyl ester carboxylesterase